MVDQYDNKFCKICKQEVVWVNFPDVHMNKTGNVCVGHSDKQIIDVYVKGLEPIG